MEPEVYDAGGVRRDWAYLTQTYGPSVRYLDAGAAPKFRLMRIDETVQRTEIKLRVLDVQGQPAQNFIALHWMNAEPPLPSLHGGGLLSLWEDTGIVQMTNAEGFTAFGMGSGGIYGHDGGPYTAWVASPSLRSDGLAGIGWLGGTQYQGPLFLTFQIVESVVPPPPVPNPGSEDLEHLVTLATAMLSGPLMSSNATIIAQRARDVLNALKAV